MNYALSATAAEVFTYIGFVILAIVALMVMIVIHELGHYLAGKWLGFKINEFAIGFGPPIFKHRAKSGELFTIRPIPIGGFCAFAGEDEDNPDPKAFNNQKPWKRLIVLFSGAFFNFLSSIFFITLFFSVYGQVLPTVTTTSDSAYFQEGDAILAIDGKQSNILMPEDVEAVFEKAGNTATFKVLRMGKTVTFTASKSYHAAFEDGDIIIKINSTALGENEYIDYSTNADKIEDYVTEKGTFVVQRGDSQVTVVAIMHEGQWSYYGYGITRSMDIVRLPFFTALGRSFGFAFFVVFKILVVKTIAESTMMSFSNFLYIIAIISANLAVMNLLPIPALDGARMVFTVIEWIRGKPLNRKVEGIIHTVGLILLLLLTVFLDIFHLVS